MPTIQGGVMKVIKEMPPDLDNKREMTEVQVLEEGEVFDVDAFLASIPKPGMTQPQCPLTQVVSHFSFEFVFAFQAHS